MFSLVVEEMLCVFVNTLTADGKYRVLNCENLQLQIQMHLSVRRKTFSQFFLESTSHF